MRRWPVLLLKVAVLLGPPYVAAYLTGQIVWVVPTLVASGYVAATIGGSEQDMRRWPVLLLKVAVLLGPPYVAAYLTGQMVWVVPTLVASGYVAATIGGSEQDMRRNVDEDDGDDEGDEAELESSLG